jgi:hypothetical protein
MSRATADHLAAWMTGLGVGLVALMLTWLVGHRLAGLIWDPPTGPIVGLGTAMFVGAVTTLVAGRRLSRTVAEEDEESRSIGSGSSPAETSR